MEEKEVNVKTVNPKLVQGSSTFKIEIPKNVEDKIRYICNRVYDVEWSGILFYKVEGSMEDNSFRVICLDILVMDIGTSGSTSYKDNPDIIQYRVLNRNTLLQPDVYEGLIHSHNTMTTFFSGTDTQTLLEEGNAVSHFVSLIVNNAGTYTARITRKLIRKAKINTSTTIEENSYYNSFEGSTIILKQDDVSSSNESHESEETIVEWFPLDIVKDSIENKFEDVGNRLSAIRKSKRDNTHIELPKPESHSIAYSNKVTMTGKNLYKEPDLFHNCNRTVHEEKDIVKTFCTQLLTGCILTNKESKVDLIKWVRNMDKVYVARFGDINLYNSSFEYWISSFIEFLMLDAEFVENVDSIVTFLDNLPESVTKSIIIEQLQVYIDEYGNDVKDSI